MLSQRFEIGILVINYQFVHASCFKSKNYLSPVFLKTWKTLVIQAEQR